MKLLIVNGSVRESQATSRVSAWVEKTAKQSVQGYDIELIDLKELALPMFDEAVLPMMNPDRESEGNTKRWLEVLASADGYIFVTPEYNHALPSGLKNAIDYINFQIMDKPFLVVSHGANGGARSGEQLKQALNANIGAIPMASSVTINGMVGFNDLISEEGVINQESMKSLQKDLESRLEKLVWFTEAIKSKRTA
jgi:NAD(P)H-dependent FMN reductase